MHIPEFHTWEGKGGTKGPYPDNMESIKLLQMSKISPRATCVQVKISFELVHYGQTRWG